MIRLTRLSGHEFWLNSDLIESMEATPDTVLSLVDGRRIVVQEPPAIVAQMCVAFRASILLAAGASVLDEAKLVHGATDALLVARGDTPNHPTQVEIDVNADGVREIRK